ncbi:hypothetical protein B0H11DRAFT_1904056 [Mycena galericulata]|nr:hypothetical protein B0H11DRAFT_1904056 [Mycena galericulata]
MDRTRIRRVSSRISPSLRINPNGDSPLLADTYPENRHKLAEFWMAQGGIARRPPPKLLTEAAVSTIYGANVAAGRTWNSVLSHYPPGLYRGSRTIKPFSSVFDLNETGTMLRNHSSTLADAVPLKASLIVTIDEGLSPRANAILVPANPYTHGCSHAKRHGNRAILSASAVL